MSHFEHVMRLQDLDRKIEEAESEMKAILGHLKLDRIESLNDIPDAKLRARYDRLQLKVKDFKRLKRGGYRNNSGRKCKYDGFETCVMRVPKLFREEVERFIEMRMAEYGYEKHQTDYEKKREAEKAEKKRQAEERNRAYWLARAHDKNDDVAEESAVNPEHET